MPSLPTNNSKPGCESDAYSRYLPSGYQYSFELYEKNRLKILCSFFQWLIGCIFMTILVLIGNFTCQYLKYQFENDLYYKNNVDYMSQFTWFMILSFYCTIIIFICYRQLPKQDISHCLSLLSSKRWKLSLYFLSFTICILLLYSIQAILLSLHHYNPYYTNFKILCNIFICKHWRFDTIFNYVISPPLSLCIVCTTLHCLLFGISTLPCTCCCYCCFKHRRKSNVLLHSLNGNHTPNAYPNNNTYPNNNESDDDEDDDDDDDSSSSSDDAEEQLNDSSMNSTFARYIDYNPSQTILSSAYSAFSGSNEEARISQRERHRKKFMSFKYPEIKMIKYFYHFCIGLFVVYLGFFIVSNLDDRFYDNEFTLIYIFLFILTELIKWCLKRIARMVDMTRSHEILVKHRTTRTRSRAQSRTRNHSTFNRNNNIFDGRNHDCYLSFELVTELFMSCVYWLAYRELVMYSVPTWTQFWKVKLVHIALEYYYYSLRPSDYYYKITKYVQDRVDFTKLVTKGICCCCFKRSKDRNMVKLLLNFNDDSTLIQWKIRCSLDIVIKFTASVISSIVIAIEVIILGYKTFDDSRELYNRGIMYNAISTGIEVLYFVLIYLYQAKIHQFSLLEPFWSIYIANKKLIILTTAVFVSQAFWFPDIGDIL